MAKTVFIQAHVIYVSLKCMCTCAKKTKRQLLYILSTRSIVHCKYFMNTKLKIEKHCWRVYWYQNFSVGVYVVISVLVWYVNDYQYVCFDLFIDTGMSRLMCIFVLISLLVYMLVSNVHIGTNVSLFSCILVLLCAVCAWYH
jgi:hypothetical protein